MRTVQAPSLARCVYYSDINTYFYIQNYMEIFQSEELPTPMTILEANARINHLAAQVDALNTYKQKMEDVRSYRHNYCTLL